MLAEEGKRNCNDIEDIIGAIHCVSLDDDGSDVSSDAHVGYGSNSSESKLLPLFNDWNAGDASADLCVRTTDGRTENILVSPSSPIFAIKAAISDRTGIPTDQQRLAMSGKELRDERQLGDYLVSQDDTELRPSAMLVHLIEKGGSKLHFTDIDTLPEYKSSELTQTLMQPLSHDDKEALLSAFSSEGFMAKKEYAQIGALLKNAFDDYENYTLLSGSGMSDYTSAQQVSSGDGQFCFYLGICNFVFILCN